METALVLNCTNQEIKVQAYGNWFTFKPKQYKQMSKDIASFLTINRGYLGLMGLPSFISEEVDQAGSEEYESKKKEAIEIATKEGVQKRIAHLQGVIRNLEVSLKKDFISAQIQVDPLTIASDGELAAYR